MYSVVRTIICKGCGVSVETRSHRTKWCGYKCRNKAAVEKRNKRCSECNCFIKNYKSERCRKCAVKYVDHYWGDAISKSLIGKPHPMKNQYYKPGALHPNWKGGGTYSKRQSFMGQQAYKDWRRKVFERDNYTCIHCGVRGGTLHADHIKPYASYPDLRLDVDNGQTLCKECHRKTGTWGYNKIYQVPQPHDFKKYCYG